MYQVSSSKSYPTALQNLTLARGSCSSRAHRVDGTPPRVRIALTWHYTRGPELVRFPVMRAPSRVRGNKPLVTTLSFSVPHYFFVLFFIPFITLALL